MNRPLTRRAVAAGAAALPLFAIGHAGAAEFEYKFATGQSPGNPVNLRAQEAIDRIRAATGGRLEIKLFVSNQLGSDTDLISQIRAGGIEFLNISGSVLSTLVPSAALVNVGFAFNNYDQVYRGLDGALGTYIEQQIDRAGVALIAPFGDNGFRQITSDTPIRTPEDLRGFHIRVPVSPIFTSLFQALGAAPVSINFNELYGALQTKLVSGEENGLVVVDTGKLYEVQKYCAETNHIWDSFCQLANRRALGRLPPEMQEIVRREFKQSILEQRADNARLTAGLKTGLEAKGMTFTQPDRAAFRAVVAKTSFYGDWKAKFGDAAWGALEAVSGELA